MLKHRYFVVVFLCFFSTISLNAKKLKTKSGNTKNLNQKYSEENPEDLQDSIKNKQKILQNITLDASLDKIAYEKKLESLRREIEQLKLSGELKRLKIEFELMGEKVKFQKALLETKKQTEYAKVETELLKAKLEKEQQKLQSELNSKRAITERANAEIEKMKSQIDFYKSNTEVKEFVAAEYKYLKDPLNKTTGILTISDRRIDLDGIISRVKANYVVKMINFYNLKDSKAPIFLVINISPGGYLRSGFRIVEAMKSSKAPVYVVLTEFAASMAAMILTCADRSFALPFAQILHHQPYSLLQGNIKEKSYQMQLSETTTLFSLGKVVEKMNLRMSNTVKNKLGGHLTVAKFIEKMYEDKRTGDWLAYADSSIVKENTLFRKGNKYKPMLSAKELGWITDIVKGIEDKSVSVLPKRSDFTLKKFIIKYYDLESLEGATVVKNNKGIKKIRLNPPKYGDYLYIYNDGSFIM